MHHANRFTKYAIVLALPAFTIGLCWFGVHNRIPEASTEALIMNLVIIVAHILMPWIAFAVDRERPARFALVGAASVLLPEWAAVSYSLSRPCPPGWSCEWEVFLFFGMALFTPTYALYVAGVVAGCRALRAKIIARRSGANRLLED